MDYSESLLRHSVETLPCSVCDANSQAADISLLGHQAEL